MSTHPLRYAGAIALVCISNSSFAATELSPVTISASRIEPVSASLPVGTLILDQDDIRNSPAKNTADLLDSIAGLSVRRSFGVAGSRSNFDLLGFGITGNSNTLLLLNGRRITNPDSAALNLSGIPLSAIKRIEILPGSGSALYGYGASGGVINVVTLEQYDNNAGITLSGGDFASQGAELWGSGQNGDTSALANVRGFNSDGYRDNNEVRQRSAFIDVRQQFDALTLYLTTLADKERLGLPGTRVVIPGTQDQFEDDPQGTDTPANWAREQRVHWMPGMELRIANGLRFNLDGGQLEKNQQSWFANFPYYSDVDITQKTVSPRLSGEHATGPLTHRWTLGFELEEIESTTNSGSSPTGATTFTTVGNRRDKTWYLHDVINFSDKLALTVGARQSHVSTRFDSGGFITRTRDELEMYQAGIQYKPVQQFALFANSERSARLANFDEFSFSDDILKPQTGWLHSAGASWDEGRQHSILTFWRGDFDNEIVYDPTAGLFGANTNLDDQTRRQGATLNSRWTISDSVSATLNGTVQSSRYADGPNSGKHIPLVPQRSAYVQIDWRALDWMKWTLAHRYIGERPFDGDERNLYDPLPSYTWTDLITTMNHNQLWLQIGVYNLTDELVADYGFRASTTYSADPLPERHVMASIGIEF